MLLIFETGESPSREGEGGLMRAHARWMGLFVRWRCVMYIDCYDAVYFYRNVIEMCNLPASNTTAQHNA